MRRREFITLLGGATVVWPRAAHAQQPERMRRIGVMATLAETDPVGQAHLVGFREGLQALGWSEGRNLKLEIRRATTDPESIERSAKELVALQPDLILTPNTPSTAALQRQTRTIPILFVNVSDPIGSGSLQFPVKFELVINRKTAEALGLDVPASFYWRADEVIE